MLYAFKLGRKLRGEEPYCPEKGGKGGSSDKSAKYAAEAQKYAADLQNQQWQTIMKNLAPFTPLGVNPQDVAQMYQQNPRQFGEFVDHLGMNSLGPEKYFDLQDKMQGRQVTMRGQDLIRKPPLGIRQSQCAGKISRRI